MIARHATLLALIASASAGLSLAAAQPLAAGDVEGSYCLRGVMEVGSCLRLSAGGTFEYFLAYGAYDETSQGRWRLDGGDVVLESPAYDKAARFAFMRLEVGKGAGFDIVVHTTTGQPVSGINVRAACDGRTVEVGVTGAVGYEVKCASAPTQVSLGLDMYGVPYQNIGLYGKTGAGKVYVFEFDPGDLGKKRFAATHLKREGKSTLLMTYGGSPIRELEGKPFTYERQ